LALINKISLDGFQQRRLIAFSREQVVAAVVGDLRGDVPLAPHGVRGDQQALDLQCLEQFRDGGDLITLGGDLFLAEDEAQFRGEGTGHVNGAAPLPDPRTVSPSTAMPPARPSTTSATQRRKATSNGFGSSARKILRNVFSDATPFFSGRN